MSQHSLSLSHSLTCSPFFEFSTFPSTHAPFYPTSAFRSLSFSRQLRIEKRKKHRATRVYRQFRGRRKESSVGHARAYVCARVSHERQTKVESRTLAACNKYHRHAETHVREEGERDGGDLAERAENFRIIRIAGISR